MQQEQNLLRDYKLVETLFGREFIVEISEEVSVIPVLMYRRVGFSGFYRLVTANINETGFIFRL